MIFSVASVAFLKAGIDYVVVQGGGGGGWNPHPGVFDMLKYILWVVALLEACDVTNKGHHLGRHLGFYKELEIRLKPQEIVIFCALHEK